MELFERGLVKALCRAWGSTSVRLIRADDQSRLASEELTQIVLAYEFAAENAQAYDYHALIRALDTEINGAVASAGEAQFHHGDDPARNMFYVQTLAACLAQTRLMGDIAGLADPPTPDY